MRQLPWWLRATYKMSYFFQLSKSLLELWVTIDWMFVNTPNSHVENLTHNVMIWGDGALGIDKLLTAQSTWMGLVHLLKRPQNALSAFLSLCAPTKERPCEDIVRRWLFASQEESFDQKPDLLSLWSWISQPADLWEYKDLLFKLPNLWLFCYSSPSWLRYPPNHIHPYAVHCS